MRGGGAGAVLSGAFEDHYVVAGNPARAIRRLGESADGRE